MKFVRCFFIISLVCLSTVQAQTTPADIFNFPELDFDTPEAAIEHFAESIAKNDLTGALQAFTINDYADKFDFTAFTERIAAINIYQGLAPSEYSMYAQLNRLELLSKYAFNIKLFCYSFYSSEPLDGSIIPIRDELEKVKTFITSVSPEQLATLSIKRAFRFIASEKMWEIWQKQAAPVGAEETSEVVVLYQLNNEYFLGGFHLLRYGQNWKIDGLSSVLAGMDADGSVSKMTVAEFEEFITELSSNENWTLEEVTL
jgi:hypothetical protein